jgi:hypothetical protein
LPTRHPNITSIRATVGGVIKSLEFERQQTLARFASIEASIAKMQATLESRTACGQK